MNTRDFIDVCNTGYARTICSFENKFVNVPTYSVRHTVSPLSKSLVLISPLIEGISCPRIYIIDFCYCTWGPILKKRESLKPNGLLIFPCGVPVQGLKILDIVRCISLKKKLDCRKNAPVGHIFQTLLKATNAPFTNIISVSLTAPEIIPIKLYLHCDKWLLTLLQILFHIHKLSRGAESFQTCHFFLQVFAVTSEMQGFEFIL